MQPIYMSRKPVLYKAQNGKQGKFLQNQHASYMLKLVGV